MTASRTTKHRGVAALIAPLLVTAGWTVQPDGASAAGVPASHAPRAVAADLQDDTDALAAAGAIGVVASATGPRLRWSGAAGVRSIDAGTPARAGDVVRVGSVTKSMVATLALQEVQRSRWRLSTTVGEVLPRLMARHGSITLEQLLSHRSGLPDYLGPILASATTNAELLEVLSMRYTNWELVHSALSQPRLFRPGTAFSYSNTNYVVLGLMLSKVTQKPLARLLTKRIFGPARMTSASFARTRWRSRPPHLSEYAMFERPYNLDRTSPTLFSAAGAVVASTRDVDRFYRALFTGRLLRADLVRSMATPRSTGPLSYGLGIYAVTDPCPGPKGGVKPLYGHDGATFGTQTLAFTSADGTRQASIAWTGRQYVAAPTTAEPANDFLVDAFVASCPRPVPAGATRADEADERPGADRWPSLASVDLADPRVTRFAAGSNR